VRVFEALKGLPTGALAGLRQADAVALDVKAAGTAILGYWTGQEANAVLIPSGIPQGHKPRPLWIANAKTSPGAQWWRIICSPVMSCSPPTGKGRSVYACDQWNVVTVTSAVVGPSSWSAIRSASATSIGRAEAALSRRLRAGRMTDEASARDRDRLGRAQGRRPGPVGVPTTTARDWRRRFRLRSARPSSSRAC
jgi:hypothetical protein